MARRIFRKRWGRTSGSLSREGERAAQELDPKKFARELLGERRESYREQSLRVHGWICARCAREFEASELHLLTVHHKDGNPNNNPPDGSNWENLCAYCHEEEHRKMTTSGYWQEDA